MYKIAKINFVTSWTEDIIRTAYYIHGWINFCCFISCVSLNDGPYTLL